MLFFFAFSLLALLFITYTTSGKNLLSPALNVCISFSTATAFCLAVYDRWGYVYTSYGILILLICLTVFILGQITGQAFAGTCWQMPRGIKQNISPYYLNKSLLYIIFILYCIYSCVYVEILFQKALSLGWNGDVSTIVRFLRSANVRDVNALHISNSINLLRMFFKAFIYYLLYITVHNYLLFQIKKNIFINVLFVVVYLFIYCMTGGRIVLLEICAYLYAVFLLKIYQKSRPSNVISLRVAKYALLSFALVLTLFIFIGLAKKEYRLGVFNELAIYAGSPLPLFDMYINARDISHEFFGQECFTGLYRLLSRLGGTWPEGIRFLEFRYWGEIYRSNIYSAFRRYIQDFGLVGAQFVIFFIGMLASLCFERIRRHRAGLFFEIMYAFFFYVWLEFVIDERLFYTFLTAGNFAFMFFMYIIIICHSHLLGISQRKQLDLLAAYGTCNNS